MAKSSRFTKSKNAARSVLGSIPIKGVIKKGAKALKKASKAAKKKVSDTKKKVVASLKIKKKPAQKQKKLKIVKKRGKVFTKARKLKNNLTKKERIQNLKKNMNKAVLAAKSIPKKTANYVKDHVKEIASFAVDSTPYVGTAKAFQQATTGVDLITGQKLSTGDRIAEGVGGVASIVPIPGAKHVGKYGTKGIIEAGEFVADTTINFANKVKGKVDGKPSKPSKETGEFEGTLKGEKVVLKDVRTQEIVYNKRAPEDTAQLRKDFNTVRKNYLKDLANEPEKVKQLREAGLSDADTALMKNGNVPIGWQVHHKLPLDDGGTNSYDNLVLIKNDPYHKVITNAQMDATRGLKPGESKTMNWPIPDGIVYPKKPE